MDLAADFAFVPISNTPGEPAPAKKVEPVASNRDLGPLAHLPGVWKGKGFNAIWRPSHKTQDRFLELNVTDETIEFERIPGNIPNRGFTQGDLFMTGVRYLQQIADANVVVGEEISVHLGRDAVGEAPDLDPVFFFALGFHGTKA